MKIDRRSFLSLSIGATAGVTLSPLPWKLTDDLSIWTQNWPWTPVPLDGATTYEHSVCALCPGGCGIAVRKVGDRAVKIEGTDGHPVNDGGICMLGLSGLQLLYGPTRVKTPLKRVGKRGEGKWKKISWEQAITEVASTLSDLRSTGKPWAAGCISGSDKGITPNLFKRFMSAYGSPNFMAMPSMADSYSLAMRMMQGQETMPGFDFENADFILSFGSGILDGWGSPVRMFKANSQWVKSGGKVVQIEPRLSSTAAKAYKWLPVKPGTETALALGIAHVIIRSNLYNRDFVSGSTSGFNAFKKLVLEQYNPAKVAEITGIADPSKIESIAKEFAKAKRPIAICGKGQGDVTGGLYDFMAVHALNALVGNINKPGGVLAFEADSYINWSEPRKDSVAADGLIRKRIDGAGSGKYPHARSLLNRLSGQIGRDEKYPMEVLFISGANPLYSMPDTNSLKKAFDQVSSIVSFSSYMDETAMYADIILPNHMYLERYDDAPIPPGMGKPVVGLLKPVVKPQFDTMHSGDVLIRLANEMGGSIKAAFPWDDFESCIKETFGDHWDTLENDGFWVDSKTSSGKKKFATDSGKFEFYAENINALPIYKQAKIENSHSYPLALVPYDSIRLAHNYIGDPPFAMKTVEATVLKGNDLFIEINPTTAKTYRLSNGGRATLSTPVGNARVRVNFSEGIMPNVIAMPKGLGHTAFDMYLADKGVNFNELIVPIEDPASGFDAAWGIMAKLAKA